MSHGQAKKTSSFSEKLVSAIAQSRIGMARRQILFLNLHVLHVIICE